MNDIKADEKKSFSITKRYLFFSLLFSACGVCLLLVSYFQYKSSSCEKMMNEAVREGEIKIPAAYQAGRWAIYLVKNANLCCHPLLGYEKIKSSDRTRVAIFVSNDYTDNDIENFKDAFQVPAAHRVARLKDFDLMNLKDICGYKAESQYNILMLLKPDSTVELLRRF